ncbi:MAG TPA: hypothetical protein VK662_09990 [Acidothermaceae bacterium]|nr:hypothetical protein [Acidothermaceae bacterium]
MARLLSSSVARFETDFAGLIVGQTDSFFQSSAGSFAGSAAGAITMLCGTKYADLQVTVQRWDLRPEYEFGWEDRDEVPFEERLGSGALMVSGFEMVPGSEHDITGLGRARALIHARGRYRYEYGDHSVPDGLPPEEWLIQLFPDPDAHDALHGEPRRLAGRSPLKAGPRGSWHAALHVWQQTGWSSFMASTPGYLQVSSGLWAVGGPCTKESLLQEILRRHPYTVGEGGKGGAADGPVPLPGNIMRSYKDVWAMRREQFASLAGLPFAETYGDVIDALIAIGLLLRWHRSGTDLLVLNPSPGLVSDAVDLDPALSKVVLMDRYSDFRAAADDLRNLLRWAAGHAITSTPRRIGVRLCLAPEEVIGALRQLRTQRTIDIDVPDEDLTPNRTFIAQSVATN